MAWIKTVGQDQAKGILKRQYDAALKRAGKIYNIVKISSLKPKVVRSSMAFYVSLMQGDGSLSRTQREMIAVVVSKANDCFY
jgi:alkylhydroperoxidase family enzyme